MKTQRMQRLSLTDGNNELFIRFRNTGCKLSKTPNKISQKHRTKHIKKQDFLA